MTVYCQSAGNGARSPVTGEHGNGLVIQTSRAAAAAVVVVMVFIIVVDAINALTLLRGVCRFVLFAKCAAQV